MKYLFQSIKYVLKNCIYLIPLAILPAVLLALSLDMQAISKVLEYYFGNGSVRLDEITFSEIFRALSVANFRSVGKFLLSIASFVAFVLCTSLILAFIDKNMRIGKRTWSGVFSKLNDNIMSTAGIAFLLFFIEAIWALLTSALLFFISRIDNASMVYVFSVLAFGGLEFVFLFVVSEIYLWLPCLQITGFHAFEALRYSNQLVLPVKWKIVIGQFLGLTLLQVTLLLLSAFSNYSAFVIIATALYVVLFLVFCVKMEVVYFDRAQLERADLRKYYYI